MICCGEPTQEQPKGEEVSSSTTTLFARVIKCCGSLWCFGETGVIEEDEVRAQAFQEGHVIYRVKSHAPAPSGEVDKR